MENKKSLVSREILLTKQAYKYEDIEIEGIGTIRVRELSGKAMEDYQQSMMVVEKDEKGVIKRMSQTMDNFRAKLAVATICDENGDPLLSKNDYAKFADSINATSLSKIVEVAQRINGMTEKEKDELTKNLEAVQSDNSTSVSA